jgi:hypothetical protein
MARLAAVRGRASNSSMTSCNVVQLGHKRSHGRCTSSRADMRLHFSAVDPSLSRVCRQCRHLLVSVADADAASVTDAWAHTAPLKSVS